MKFELVVLKDFSGRQTTIYSAILEDEGETLFDKFINENIEDFNNDIIKIAERLEIIGDETGARESFFKMEQGIPGDLVSYLRYEKKQKLRLYCIRFGMDILVLGSGGFKPENIKALQESEKLDKENNLVKYISKRIYQRIKEKAIEIPIDDIKLIGNLKFNDNEEI